MTLSKKVADLKTTAALAGRMAEHWEKQIAEHGEVKATAFYKHLGLNHLEVKGVEWEGLTLSRQPNEREMVCVKAVHQVQESGKKKLFKILSGMTAGLIGSAISDILKLSPSEYHTLVLDPPKDVKPEVLSVLEDIYTKGRTQVAKELVAQGATVDVEAAADADIPAAIDELADVTISSVVNDLTSRVAGVASRAVTVGLEGDALQERIARDTGNLSDAPEQRAAAGAANRGLGMGRRDEAQELIDSIGRYEYSALLDNAVCEACAPEDGTTATDPDDLVPTPNPDCLGGANCRCFTIYIVDEED